MTASTRGAPSRVRRAVGLMAASAMLVTVLPAAASAQQPPLDPDDPRVGLEEGYQAGEAGEAALGIDHLANVPKPEEFSDGETAPVGFGGIGRANSDLAFTGDYAIMGSYLGFTIYDISDPAEPTLEATVACAGGQGDVSIYGDLLFVSTESGSRTDCAPTSSEALSDFVGLRIFDLGDFFASGDAADIGSPITNVQTCRGSHTHTVVDPGTGDEVYIYISGTAGVRGASTIPDDVELDCNSIGGFDREDMVDEDGEPLPNDRFQIEVIEVPLDDPATAEIVNEPRVFANEEGNPHGLNPGGSQGAGFQSVAGTDSCHDITAYPEIGLAAGACEGNGILLDITDPANPERVAEVADRNFAYWHSATFSNDGSKVVFTDEWGGGGAARCLATDRPEWGANAIFDVIEGADGPELQFAQYYKLPAPQTTSENCVAHNGTLVPVPGRDVMVQAWYQGGISLWDFSDSASPYEIGYFDRGPTTTEGAGANLAGFWSAYWYDGNIYGSEIVRGFDSFELSATDGLSAEEISAAEGFSYGGEFNAQAQVSYDVSPVPDPEPGPEGACDAVEPVTFRDVVGPPHDANIGCVAGYGIALGTSSGDFRPAADVRRDQMASFLQRTLQVGGVELPEVADSGWSDADGGPHETAIGQLTEVGIIQGTQAGVYDPSGTVTRAQMASFLRRTLEFATGEELSAPRSPFTDIQGSVHASSIDVVYDLDIALGRTATTYQPSGDVRRDQMGSFLARTLDVMEDVGLELTPLPSE